MSIFRKDPRASGRSIFKKVASPLNRIFGKVASGIEKYTPQIQNVLNNPATQRLADSVGAGNILGLAKQGAGLLPTAGLLARKGQYATDVRTFDKATSSVNELEKAINRVRN
jgi:hypothetical protein